MHPDLTGAVGAFPAVSRVLLGLLTATTLSAAAQSIPGLPGLGGTKAESAAPAASAPTSADWAARLEVARAEHQALLALPAGGTPLLDQRQIASARRLVLLAARVEALKSKASGDTKADAEAVQIPKLSGQPPYSVLDVDALRDRLDILTTQQSALELGLKQLDVTVDEAVRARSEADANLRRHREQASQAGPAVGNVEELRAQVALAELLSQVMELEVLQNDERRQRARSRLAALAEPVKQLQAEIDRGRSQMRFDDADLARILKGIAAERQKLSAESAKLSERLARLETQAVPPGEGWRRRATEPLQKSLQMLGELETMERGYETLWRARHEVIAKRPEPGLVQATALKIGKALADLQDQRRRVTEERRLARSELRTQQALMADLAADDPALKGEEQVLSALQAESEIQDRLRDGIDRATVLLERSRIDMGGTDKPASAEDWALRAWGILAQVATAIWQFELFTATETTQIDGRVITVEHGVTVGKSIGVLVMLVLGYWAAGRLSRLLIDLARRRVPMSTQLARVLRRWVNSILLLVVMLLVLKMARIPLTAFAFLGGALAIGIGFGAQNVIKNLISGVIILFERKIRVGDVVSIGGMSGTVTTVDLRATTVRGFDGIDAIVPNSTLLENQISNWSGGSPDVRRTVTVGVAYGSDLRKAAQLILDCAKEHQAVLPEPPAEVLFEEFGANDLTLRLYYWTRLGGPRGGPGVDSDLRFAIADALAAAGIGMAFPQRDVHLDLVKPLQVELLAGGKDA
jgi:small-conductance mechanosensitive channel